MTSDKKKSGADPIGDIRLGFDGLLGALGDVLSEVTERLETGQAREFHKIFEIDTGKGPVRAEAGVRMRFADPHEARAGASRSMARPVHSRKANAATTATVTPPRPIDFEIVEDGTFWSFSADIPGVDQGELKLSEEDGRLVIETTGARRFQATCPLPQGLRAGDLTVSLRNGILELTATRGEEGSR